MSRRTLVALAADPAHHPTLPPATRARSLGKSRHAVRLPLKGVVLLVLAMALLWPLPALAESVQARFDLSTPQGGPFPSDRFTVRDPMHNTGLRVELPKPNCAERPSDCMDLDVINTLDGFNLQPRLSIPFDGPIDVASVTGATVFLVRLESTLPGGEAGGQVVGINQIVWDTFSNTLHVESDEFLDQHTRYALLVTKKVFDEDGKEVKASKEFLNFVDEANFAPTGDPALDAYRTLLRNALTQIDVAGIVPRGQVVAASMFTTQSVTAILEKMRDQIKAMTPAPADFLLGPGASRTVFAPSDARTSQFNQQKSVDPTAGLTTVALNLTSSIGVEVGRVAFGRYGSPDYRVHPGEFIPPVGTLSGTPVVRGTSQIVFLLWLPSSPKPAGGYPVAIYGHPGSVNKIFSRFFAAKLAEQGIATIAIDFPGAGFGPLSTYSFTFNDSSSLTFLAGGRGIDQNGDGRIDEGEGFRAAGPRAIQFGRDGYRQWAADNMQLVREIEVGMDVDGDGVPDLDPSRIYFLGSSMGTILGALFLAVEPSVRAGVLTSPVSSTELRRLSADRALGPTLQSRVPSLIDSNSNGIKFLLADLDKDSQTLDKVEIPVPAPYFDENMPLRDGVAFSVVLEKDAEHSREIRSPLINDVAGAMEIQQVIEDGEWASQAGDSVAYARYLRGRPLDGMYAKSVIIQFANGDRTAPNPFTTAILRAGDLADRATFVRTNCIVPHRADPHAFADASLAAVPEVRAIALKAQHQIASFFASDGTLIIDPDNAPPALDKPIFEVPVVRPPETLNYFVVPKPPGPQYYCP